MWREISQINKSIVLKFAPFFKEHTFLLSLNKELNAIASSIVFVRESNFVLFSIENIYTSNMMQGNITQAREKWGISVRIGDGGYSYPELLWSSIQLDNYLSTQDTYDYQFNKLKELSNIEKRIEKTLIIEAKDFLNRELNDFYKKRAEMVKLKEVGYIIKENLRTGEKKIEVNEEVAFFKTKYGSL